MGPFPFHHVASAAVLALASCSGSSSPDVDIDAPESLVGIRFADFHSGGASTEMHLASVRFGRLVNVQARNAAGAPVTIAEDFVIGQNVISDELNFELTLNGVTGQETLLVKRNVDDPAQMTEIMDLLGEAAEALDPIQVRDLGAVGVLSMLPRNAALVLTFDDLLRPESVNDRTIELLTGYPPTGPFEARVFPSAHHGGTAGDGAFYPTRVIVDLTTALIERQRTGSLVPLNEVGLPPSLDEVAPNIQLRIPTVVYPSIGLTRVLVNLSNHELSTVDNGPVDFSTNTRPVTRAIRSGGSVDLVGDPFNGFLRDTTPPKVVGSTPLDVTAAPVQQPRFPGDEGSLDFILPEAQVLSELCGQGELRGDEVIAQNGLYARVVKPAGLTPGQADRYTPDEDGRLFDLPVRLITFPQEWPNGPGDWEQFGAVVSALESTYEVGNVPDCFLQVLPRPSGFPNEPTKGVDPAAIVSVRFSEPMDPASLTAFDSMTLTRTAESTLTTSDYVVGELNQSASLREVTFVPVLSLAHRQGVAESYYLGLAGEGDPFRPKDLAGNPLVALPTVALEVEAEAPTVLNGGRVSRYSSDDEEEPVGAEWAGQIQFQPTRQALLARPVVRQRVVIDNEEQALPAQMTAFPPGVITPFSPLGAKMQALWRYCDCGFSLTDATRINIDIEGLSWSPSGGSVVPDIFEGFEIRLSHSRVAPDETINPQTLFPQFERSGLKAVFAQNVLPGEVQQVVHSRERGYTIEQGDIEETSNGTPLLPMPLNRGIPDDDKRYFTWRDTRIRGRAGPLGNGVEPLSYAPALGLPVAENPYYSRDSVQTIGLPLLMEFRVSPQLSAAGRNAWVLNLAVNSSSKPYFRAFSSGGVNTAGNQVLIDPDNETNANGGFDPVSTPPGAPTFGRDNSVHIGAIDYVTRISQGHSIWFESLIESEAGGSFGGRIYSEPTVEPAASDQPDGTSVSFFYRGATEIVVQDGGINGVMDNVSGDPGLGLADYQYNARTLDLYGDYYNDLDATTPGVHSPDHTAGEDRDNYGLSFLPGPNPEEWKGSVADITGARFYQVRLTFFGNPVTGQAPGLSAFALTWTPE